RPPSGAFIAACRGILPESLLELWEHIGLGFYADGLIQLIDPRAYRGILLRWLNLGDDDRSRLPIALTAFGKLIYYRKIDAENEDVSCLNQHTSEARVFTWSLDEFFNDWMPDRKFRESELDANLVGQAAKKHGPLAENE